MCDCVLQTMLLEKLRVTKRPASESTFNVFYYMMAGADSNLRWVSGGTANSAQAARTKELHASGIRIHYKGIKDTITQTNACPIDPMMCL